MCTSSRRKPIEASLVAPASRRRFWDEWRPEKSPSRRRRYAASRTVTSCRYSNSLASFRRTYQPAIHRPRTPNGRAYSTRSSKKTGRRSVRLKRVRVFPVSKRARNLNIGKVLAFFKVLMFRNPAPPQWPSPKLHHHARAPFDSTGFFNHNHAFPRRREPLQRPRQRMPCIHLGRRSVDSRAANKGFRFHTKLLLRNRMRL